MKKFFLILVMGLTVGSVCAVQPARKPFLNLSVDGKPVKNGEVLTVAPGQKLNISVDMEGGRRDFCKFPDSYADIAGTAQILSRGEDGLAYTLDGVRAEWRLKSEEFQFETDDFIKATAEQGKHSAELVVTNAAFSQSYVKVTANATWQFSSDGKTSTEENTANTTVYFKLAGASDQWFSSKNLRATGLRNGQVEEKLTIIQAADDSIVKNFHRLNFAGVQQAIRNLQAKINELKATIDEVKGANPSYQAKITFVGLPSDDPYSDIEAFNSVKTNWANLEATVSDLKAEVAKLPEQGSNENKKSLFDLVKRYNEWYAALPENDIVNLGDYIPEIKLDDVKLPQNLMAIINEKTIDDYSATLGDFKAFLDKRTEQLANETQQINSVQSRIQAVRLFDGMLRSYFSSIVWADWESTRGF